jgi:hypothetical protein
MGTQVFLAVKKVPDTRYEKASVVAQGEVTIAELLVGS